MLNTWPERGAGVQALVDGRVLSAAAAVQSAAADMQGSVLREADAFHRIPAGNLPRSAPSHQGVPLHHGILL